MNGWVQRELRSGMHQHNPVLLTTSQNEDECSGRCDECTINRSEHDHDHTNHEKHDDQCAIDGVTAPKVGPTSQHLVNATGEYAKLASPATGSVTHSGACGAPLSASESGGYPLRSVWRTRPTTVDEPDPTELPPAWVATAWTPREGTVHSVMPAALLLEQGVTYTISPLTLPSRVQASLGWSGAGVMVTEFTENE